MLPKTRSWLALGAPLELLSPLSVLRVLFLLLAAVWPALAVGVGTLAAGRPVVLALAAASGGTWCWLMRQATVGPRSARVLTAWATLTAVAGACAGHARAVSVVYLLLLAPIGAASVLFVGLRAVGAETLVGAIAIWVIYAPSLGSAPTAVLVAVVVVVHASAMVPLAVCVRSARHRGTVDPDTGLPNGFGLVQRLAARADDGPYVVAVTSLTGLAEAREALGYRAGAELLQRAVENLGQVVPLGTLIGRVEGDEVVAVLPLAAALPATEDVSSHLPGAGGEGNRRSASHTERALIAATAAADDLVATIAQGMAGSSYLVDDVEITLRTHVGVALSPWDGADPTELIRRSSLSARRAAAANEPRRIWDGDQGALTADDLALLAELRQAGERGELWLAYQPQVAAGSGTLVAVESLMRWQSPARGPVSPGRFIPLAERTGLVGRLTEWVLAEALDAQVRWRAQGVVLPVSVNLSATLLSRPDLSDWILEELEERSLPPEALTVEVTETAETTDILKAVTLLRPLRARGVRISLDDFGTGYTSLAALPDLPLDELKVDQGFVRRSAKSAADDAIVRTVIDLAHRLGFAVVAEGVEDAACAQRLTGYGVDLLQGYHFSKPLAETDLLRLATAASDATISGSRHGGEAAPHGGRSRPAASLAPGASG